MTGTNMDTVVYLPLLILVPKAFDNLRNLILRHCYKVKKEERDTRYRKETSVWSSILPLLVILPICIYCNINASWTSTVFKTDYGSTPVRVFAGAFNGIRAKSAQSFDQEELLRQIKNNQYQYLH
jgi:hypothetical protein